MTKRKRSPDWELLLAHAAALQTKVPGTVLVGGTAAALHAGHRVSFDHDHVLRDLGADYDTALAALESIAGWRTRRKVRGKHYLDVAALSHHLGLKRSVKALRDMSELYAEFAGEGGDMLTSVLVKLAAPDPMDLEGVDLAEYKGIVPPWNEWAAVVEQCGALAAELSAP